MKVLRRPTDNLVLQVAINIDRVEHDGNLGVIRVQTSNDLFYIATDDRDTYEIFDRDDIPADYYPSGYYLMGDTWTYIVPTPLPDPWDEM